MTKNSVLNALAAALYIVFISSVMYVGTRFFPSGPSFLAPVAVISLFTLSAAVMGYVFCYTPVIMYLDGKKKAGLELFLKTTGTFAVFTLVFLILLFSRVIR